MKKLILTTVAALLMFVAASAQKAGSFPEEYLGLPGDNLNLYAVMELFRESATLEAFERSLNNPDKIINNLDLNNDNYVDYIMVKDYVDGNVHTIVMRVALNNAEHQDVAVFTVEQFRDGSVQIQLIGDEALYGKNYIIEPVYAETPNPGYQGTAKVKGHPRSTTVVTTTYVQVASWPVIRYIYTPTYVVYRSPWYWGFYPTYWVSWRPHYWHYYYGYHYHWHSHYYSYYRPWPHHRYPRYHTVYYVTHRHTAPRVAVYIREGNYRTTYSRPDELSRGQNQYHAVHGSRNGTAQGAASGRSEVSPRTTGNTNASATVNTPRTHREAQPVNGGATSTRAQTSSGVRNGSGTESAPRPSAPAVRNADSRQESRPASVRQESAPRQESRPASVRQESAPRQESRPAAVRQESAPRQESRPATVRQESAPRQETRPATVRNGSESRQPASQPTVRNSSPSRSSGNTVNASSSSASRSRTEVSNPPSRGGSSSSRPASSPSSGSGTRGGNGRTR